MDQSPSTAQQLTFNKQVLPLPASTGHTENSVRSNLERGASIDTKHDKCVSLLQWTTDGEDMAPVTVKFPIKWGCDADSADERRLTPLHWHAAMTETTAVQELIRKGEPKSVVAGTFGTPLHQAASKGHVETVVAMLEEGCPINEVDSGNRTVLHWAAKTGYVEVVRELVSRGCDVNAVQANGSTPLHTAALFGRTEVARELVKLGASKSIIAGGFGTPLHQAIAGGHTEVVKVLLNDELCETDLTNDNAAPSKWQPSNCNVIDTCDAYGQTPMMWALKFGRLELLRLLISKGGDIPGKDIHNMSALEQCFVGGQASRLSQFCEACGIRGSNKGLRDILAALIAQGLVDPCKVLCLCAISGDSIFLEDQFIELVASGACAMPAAVKCAKYYFEKGDHFRAKFRVGDDSELNPLQMALLSLICFKMGFPVQSVKRGAKDHTLFIRKLLSHSVLKKTVNQYFPNGLTPLDLAQHFEFHHIATLIEKAGGRPGVWGGIPRAVFSAHFSELFMVTSSLMKLCDSSQGGHESVKEAMIKILGGQTVESVVHVADDNQLVKEQVLDQHPNMGDIVKHVLPHIQMRHWKKVGLSLGIKKNTLGELGQQFSSDDDCYLETLSYWLEHGSSVTWKTLLDVLGYFETWHTVDELTDKIVSVLGGGHQGVIVSGPFRPVMCSVRVVGGGAVAAERSPPSYEAKQVLDLFRDQFIADMDASTVVWELLHKGIISRGVRERISKTDEPKQQNEILYDWLQRACNKEALMEVFDIIVAVRGHPKMQNLGEDMKRRLRTATPVQVVQKHAEEFLKEMNCKVIALKLKTLKLIPESVEYDILKSKSKEEANVHLLNHLKEEADEETIRVIFRIASEEAGYGKMNKFAASVLRELQ